MEWTGILVVDEFFFHYLKTECRKIATNTAKIVSITSNRNHMDIFFAGH